MALAAKFLYRLVDSSAKPSKTRRRREPNGYSFQAVEKRRKRFMATEVPAALQKTGMFTPLFMQSVAVSYLEKGFEPDLLESDLNKGADFEKAKEAYSYILALLENREGHISIIKDAKNLGAKAISMKPLRKRVPCDKVPKEQVYELDDYIPIYPCEDCPIFPGCLVDYRHIKD